MVRVSTFILLAALPVLATLGFPHIHAEPQGSIAISLSYPNGDTADYTSASLKIYQDSSAVPYRVIDSLTGNPFNIVSLAEGHKYKIETYVNGLHASDTYVDLQESHADADTKIPLPGGMRLDVYYNDGVTPLPNAAVTVSSQDNRTWAQGYTNSNGQTLRFWLEPTVFQFDHYNAHVRVGSNLSYSQSPVFLQPGISQEIKIVTKWPANISNLITVRVIGPDQNPLVSSNYTVYASDGEGNMVSQSKVSRGESHFSNLKVGDYQFKAVRPDGTVAGASNETIDGSRTDFVINVMPKTSLQTPSKQPSTPPKSPPASGCNCVIFRIDGIQDYWLDNVQTEVTDMFYQMGAKQTVGIVANAFGNDAKLVSHLRSEADKIEYGINGWNFEDFTTLDKDSQASLLEQSRQKIESLIGVSPNVFIPPFGRANNDTFSAMTEGPISFLSAAPNVLLPAPLEGKIRLLPTDMVLDFHALQSDQSSQILSTIQQKIRTNGVAVVAVNFQDFADDNGTSKINASNETRLEKLTQIIDKIQSSGIAITNIEGAFNETGTQYHIPSWLKGPAGWWSEGEVSDKDFASAIRYLAQEGAIKIPQPAALQGIGLADKAKNMAGLWSRGQVPDSDFTPVVEYLSDARFPQ